MEGPQGESSPEYEWELSKENVQPLKQGRKFTNLTAALQPHSEDQSTKLKDEKRQFEIDLRTYAGDDPLDIWHRYILWMEQNFPKGGKTTSFSQLLQQCVTLFKEEERYKNDPRYLDVWMKFVKFCNDAPEIFNFMYNQSIATDLAAFYNAWALAVADLGNTKRADVIFSQGIARGAHPTDWLIKRHSEFQACVAYQLASGEMPMEQEDREDLASQRMTLGLLKGHGKSKKVGSVRTAVAKSSGLAMSQGALAPSGNSRGQGFKVFCEDENAPPSMPLQTGEWSQVPAREVVNVENDQKPAKWTDSRIHQRSAAVARTPSQPAFTVHEDENLTQPAATPRKVPELDPVLSARKAVKPVDPLKNIMGGDKGPCQSIPMYAKHLVYTGVEEFSFEELRAITWWKKKRQRDEAELEAITEKNKQLKVAAEQEHARMSAIYEEKRQQMEAKAEARLKELEAEAEAKQRDMEARIAAQRQQMEAMLTATSENSMPTDILAIGASASRELQFNMMGSAKSENSTPTDMLAIGASASRELPFNIMGRSTIFNHTPSSGASTGNMQMECGSGPLQMPTSQDSSLSNNTRTPNFFSTSSNSTNPTPDTGSFKPFSSRTPLHGCLTAPSPTVNTREAMQMVMGMFNRTLNLEKDLEWTHVPKDTPDDDLCSFSAQAPPEALPFVPFTIFQEEPSEMVETDENRAPMGFEKPTRRRGLAGILQPAQDIPVKPVTMDTKPPADNIYMDINDQILASDARAEKYIPQEEVMDCVEPIPSELTFAPNFSSTHNFTEMARFASTPFNPSAEPPEMPVPPVSSIKSYKYSADHSTAGPMVPLGNELFQNSSMAQSASMTGTAPQVASFDITAPRPPRKSNLSPIIEGNSEESKLSAGSIGSKSSSVSSLQNTTSHSNTSQASHGVTPAERPIPPKLANLDLTLFNQTCHEIDTKDYRAKDDAAELLSQSIAVNPYNDPFDSELLDQFLCELEVPLDAHPAYRRIPGSMPALKTKCTIILGKESCTISGCIAEGAYAKVYKATLPDGRDMALKVQKPGSPWEFYIVTEVHRRIGQQQNPVDVLPSVMTIDHACFFDDGSVFASDLFPDGNLLDLVNAAKMRGTMLSEPQAVFLIIEMLHISEALMKADIIHGDIKPDNYLFRGFPLFEGDFSSGETGCLQLIDFGRGIDMHMFPKGTTFTVSVSTSSFQCIEMQTHRPWTYQTDFFGLVGTMHVLLFGEYMKVYQEGGRWRTVSRFKRWLKSKEVFADIFDQFLNIPSCSEMPNVSVLRRRLEGVFLSRLLIDL